jgi:TRAP-type C4-dicarboxylate transport system substrate-binding protein
MEKKKWSYGSLSIVVAGLLAAFLFSATMPALAASEEKITLKAWAFVPENHPQARMLQWFRKAVNERAKGRLEIVWAGGPELFKTKDIPTAVSARAIDVLSSPLGAYLSFVPEAYLDAGPYWKPEYAPELSRELRDKVLSPAFETKMRMKLLAYPLIVQMNVVTKKPVTKLADMKGLTIRGTPGGIIDYIQALGATPINLPAEEVYMALERGVIDGAARPMSSYIQFKEYEVAKHIVSNPLTYATLGLWITIDAWKKLPKDLQKIVFEEGDRFQDRMVKEFVSEYTVARKLTTGYGVTWHDLSKSDSEQWNALVMKTAFDMIRKDVPKENAEKIISIIDKYLKEP